MLIRAEQMAVFERAAEDNFARRLAAHLAENYSSAPVHLPDADATVGELPAEKLHSLVEIAVERARSYGLTSESSIAAFSAAMFEVSPNFDLHRLSQVMLNDENLEPEARFDELLEVLTEKNWETIRADYDVYEWQARTEKPADGENDTELEETEQPIIETAKTPERTTVPVSIDDISFDETIRNYEAAKRVEKNKTAGNLDLPDTMLNIKLPKE